MKRIETVVIEAEVGAENAIVEVVEVGAETAIVEVVEVGAENAIADRERPNSLVFILVRSEACKILELSFLSHNSEPKKRLERVWFISRDCNEVARFNIRKMLFEGDNVSR